MSSLASTDQRRPVRRGPRLLPLRNLARHPEPDDLLHRRLLARDRLLGLQGRAPADRGPWLVAMATRARARAAVHRADHLHALPAARSTSRTCASASSRSRRWRSGSRSRDLHCPVCRAEVEATYLVCPVCTTKLKQACVKLQRAARGAVAGLPVLRDADRDTPAGDRRSATPRRSRRRAEAAQRAAVAPD